MQLHAKDFSTRQELENKVASSIGLTAESKPDHLIKGTRQELKKLQLSNGNIFWGIRVEETDAPKEKKRKTERIDRGKIHKRQKESSVDIDSSEEA